MSKTRKIRRARKARELAEVEATKAAAELKYVRHQTGSIRAKWSSILELLARELPREDIVRAMADSIPEMRVNYPSSYCESLRAAKPMRFARMVSSESDRILESGSYSIHQLIINYAEMDRSETNAIFDLKFNDGTSRFAMTTSAMMMAPDDFLVEHVASKLVKCMRGSHE